MRFKELDTLLLDRGVPEHGLRKGNLGAVVQVYEPQGLEVELVTASECTQALLTFSPDDLRGVTDQELIAIRSLVHGAA